MAGARGTTPMSCGASTSPRWTGTWGPSRSSGGANACSRGAEEGACWRTSSATSLPRTWERATSRNYSRGCGSSKTWDGSKIPYGPGTGTSSRGWRRSVSGKDEARSKSGPAWKRCGTWRASHTPGQSGRSWRWQRCHAPTASERAKQSRPTSRAASWCSREPSPAVASNDKRWGSGRQNGPHSWRASGQATGTTPTSLRGSRERTGYTGDCTASWTDPADPSSTCAGTRSGDSGQPNSTASDSQCGSSCSGGGGGPRQWRRYTTRHRRDGSLCEGDPSPCQSAGRTKRRRGCSQGQRWECGQAGS